MKKALLIIGIVCTIGAVTGAAFMLAAPANDDVAGSVLKDRTDLDSEPVQADDLCPLLYLDNKWAGISLRMLTISDYAYNKVHQVSLPGRIVLFSSVTERDKEIAGFKKDMAMCVDSINTEPIGLPHSSIYEPLMTEANRIAASKAKHKFVVAYTNCGENTPAFSVYNTKDRKLLKNNPQKVEQILEKMVKSANLNGLTVYLVYHPTTDKDNEYFTAMSRIYKRILEKAGATVIIEANLVTTNL